MQITARGGGTSQSGQTIGSGLVVDCSKYLRQILDIDQENKRCIVEPGIVLDELNREIAHTGLWFPVDVSTSSRATIGGMIGNNSCGTRSLRYGIMRDNVESLDTILASGVKVHFGQLHQSADRPNESSQANSLIRDLLELGIREAEHIEKIYPDVSRRVGGYNLDALLPEDDPVNLAALLTGSEGTLAITHRAALKLSPRPLKPSTGYLSFSDISYCHGSCAAYCKIRSGSCRNRRSDDDRSCAKHSVIPDDHKFVRQRTTGSTFACRIQRR